MKLMNLFSSGESSGVPFGVLPQRTFQDSEVVKLTIGSTSRGNQPKYKTLDGKFYIKSRFLYGHHLWKDNLVEVIASQYAHCCKLPEGVNVVKQGICELGADDCSYSEAFDLDGSSFIAFSRTLEEGSEFDDLAFKCSRSGDMYSWFSLVRDYYSECVGSDQSIYLATMMLLDLIVANEDRHLSNFGYLRGAATRVLRPSVLFDFGLGLCEHDSRYYEDMPLSRALKKIRLKPWDAKVTTVADFLEDKYSTLVSDTLPSVVNLKDYVFPSNLAREYFQWVNERLGVRVVSM